MHQYHLLIKTLSSLKLLTEEIMISYNMDGMANIFMAAKHAKFYTDETECMLGVSDTVQKV